MESTVKVIFNKVQLSESNHQKNIRLLETIYNNTSNKEFMAESGNIIRTILHHKTGAGHRKLSIIFFAKFITHILTPPNEPENLESYVYFESIVKEILKSHNDSDDDIRYASCMFLFQILQRLSGHVDVDEQLCSSIQDAMLQRLQDSKSKVRLQAVLALIRFQEPTDPKCPVISAYLAHLLDPCPAVRAEIITRIGLSRETIKEMVVCVRDVDPIARKAAFLRYSNLTPKFLKIKHRQFIFRAGFCETEKAIRNVFLNFLVPHWLDCFDNKYIEFLGGFKLYATESEVLTSEDLSKKVMETLFRSQKIDDLIQALELNEDRLLPLSSLNFETVLYWNNLCSYLREHDDSEDYIDLVIPELTSFCNFIESYLKSKPQPMDAWVHLNFDCILYHLFDIADKYDLGEVVGRENLHNHVKRVLQEYCLPSRTLAKVTSILSKLSATPEAFTTDIRNIIFSIKEPEVEIEPTAQEVHEQNFAVAQINVQITILKGDWEDAIADKDFERAAILKNELAENERRLEAVRAQHDCRKKGKSPKDDLETTLWCLDLLEVMFHCPCAPALIPQELQEELLAPLLQNKFASDIQSNVMRCALGFALHDKTLAVMYAPNLCIPVVSYRTIPNIDKSVLNVSTSAVCDLILLYGVEFFELEEHEEPTLNTNLTWKRLYDDNEEQTIDNKQKTLIFMIESILDMLDDEDEDIRNTALTAIGKILLNSRFGSNEQILTRLIVKWFNPSAGLQDKFQQLLGITITTYVKEVREAVHTIEKSVVPVLSTIVNAPKNSPLADVNGENAVKFLAKLISFQPTNGIVHIQRNLVHTIFEAISNEPSKRLAVCLSKMLTFLNILPDAAAPNKEIITQAQRLLLLEGLSKSIKHNVQIFINKLSGDIVLRRNDSGRTAITEETNEHPTVSERASEHPTISETTSEHPTISDGTNEHIEEQGNNHIFPQVKIIVHRSNLSSTSMSLPPKKHTPTLSEVTNEYPSVEHLEGRQSNNLLPQVKVIGQRCDFNSRIESPEKTPSHSDSDVIPPSISSNSTNDSVSKKATDNVRTFRFLRSRSQKKRNLESDQENLTPNKIHKKNGNSTSIRTRSLTESIAAETPLSDGRPRTGERKNCRTSDEKIANGILKGNQTKEKPSKPQRKRKRTSKL